MQIRPKVHISDWGRIKVAVCLYISFMYSVPHFYSNWHLFACACPCNHIETHKQLSENWHSDDFDIIWISAFYVSFRRKRKWGVNLIPYHQHVFPIYWYNYLYDTKWMLPHDGIFDLTLRLKRNCYKRRNHMHSHS